MDPLSRIFLVLACCLTSYLMLRVGQRVLNTWALRGLAKLEAMRPAPPLAAYVPGSEGYYHHQQMARHFYSELVMVSVKEGRAIDDQALESLYGTANRITYTCMQHERLAEPRIRRM